MVNMETEIRDTLSPSLIFTERQTRQTAFAPTQIKRTQKVTGAQKSLKA